MHRYFAREPRLSREELERQAQEAIDARIRMGRPPEEEFGPVRERLAEIDQALAVRPPLPTLPEAEPLQIHHVQLPPAAPAAPPPAAKPRPPRRQPVAAAKQKGD